MVSPKLILAVMVLLGVSEFMPLVAQQGEETAKGAPYIGVRLSKRELPALLRKHLRLDKGRGLLVENIHRDSPADKAGLDKDDIIITYQNEPITSYDDFVDRVIAGQPAQEVSLEVIHQGEKKSVTLKLAAQADFATRQGADDWKYPQALDTLYQPAWDDVWEPMDPCQPNAMMDYLNHLNQRTFVFRGEDGEYTITIDGDPYRSDADIIIRDGDEEFHTVPNRIDQFPEKYRETARAALDNSRVTNPASQFLPRVPPGGFYTLPQPYIYRVPQDTSPHTRRLIENLEEEIQTLRRHLRQMEDQMNQILEKLPSKSDPES